MKSRILCVVKYPVVFIACFLLLTLFMIFAACIPTEKIKPKMLESAEYMCERSTSYLITDWIHASEIDHYADCITLSIAHQLDDNKPLESAMWASYYGNASDRMNQLLLKSVQEDLPATKEYLRYWHGSAGAMRFLHLFWNVKTIYAFHAVLMILLGLILVLLLTKNGFKGEAMAFLIAMFFVSIWYVPLCLEYTYCFLCMLVASIIGTILASRERNEWIGPFFLVTGMVTVFFDFLTCETLTLLVPLLLVLEIGWDGSSKAQMYISSIKFSVAWGIGYLGMWFMKWVMAVAVLRIDVAPYVRGHIGERLNSAVRGYGTTGNPFYDAIVLNLKKLIPYEYGIYGAVVMLAVIFIVIVIPVLKGRVVLKRQIQVSNCVVYMLISLVPYVRYLVLRNHSIIHSFFTYRAQAASVLAICMMILECVDQNKETKDSSRYEPDILL